MPDDELDAPFGDYSLVLLIEKVSVLFNVKFALSLVLIRTMD